MAGSSQNEETKVKAKTLVIALVALVATKFFKPTALARVLGGPLCGRDSKPLVSSCGQLQVFDS